MSTLNDLRLKAATTLTKATAALFAERAVELQADMQAHELAMDRIIFHAEAMGEDGKTIMAGMVTVANAAEQYAATLIAYADVIKRKIAHAVGNGSSAS